MTTLKITGTGATLALTLTMTAPAMADTFTFRVGSGHPVAGLSHMQALDEFYLPEVAKRVEERTDHKVRWIKAYAGSLVKLQETLDATRSGLVDIGVINYPHQPTELFTHSFPFYFPFQTGDAVLATKAVRKTFEDVPWLTEVFETDYNQKFLALGANGNYGVGGTVPFENFEDLKGKKIGAAGPNLKWFDGIDVTTVTTNLGEAYNALKSGIYDGVVIFPGPYQAFKLGEVGKEFTVTNFGSPSALSINMNLEKWNATPKEIQDIFLEVGLEYEERASILSNEDDAEGLAKLKADGATIVEFPVAEQAKWAASLADYPNAMAEEATSRGAPGKEIFETYVRNLKELGYDWPYEYQFK
ncbi:MULTISPECIES: C4-dicarboxylate TRAP transporter substrate-binding protein [Marinovum]|uniref:C4-dicarboxylate TRAP transporter substrate-binding protein n=1 Tax=Marinovum TaxID=367771 RepID=UPI00237A0C08|nr:C4-dicarboxylate TRAP transporter substrate-binding protein [Marinovum sp. PR37]MDD9746853.1 C4-dicarboxylate TRAP transporter substrate-binding protein [Marinovum sp. PR37]